MQILVKKRTLLGIVFGLAAFSLLAFFSFRVSTDYFLLPLFLTFVLTILLLSPFFLDGFDIAEPYTFFASMYSGFVLSAGYSLSQNAFIRKVDVYGELGAHLLTNTLMLLIVGLMAFQAGYVPSMRKLLHRGRQSGYRVALSKRNDMLRKPTIVLVTFYLIVGVIGYYALYVRPMGGFVSLIRHFGVSGIASEVGASSMFAPVLWWAILLWYKYHLDGYTNVLFYPCIVFVLFTQFIRGRILGGVITPLLTLLVIWRYSPRGRWKNPSVTTLLIVVIIMAVLAFGVYGYRQASILGKEKSAWENIKTVLSPEGFVEKILESNNLPGITVVTQILQGVPDDISYQFGRTFLFAFEQAIPNHLMPQREEKPTVGAMVKEAWYGPWRGNQPPTLVGELYMNFSWPGVVLGMYLLGRFCVYLYQKLMYRRSDWFVIVYAVFMTKFVMLVVKGEFGDHFVDALFYNSLPIVFSGVIAKLMVQYTNIIEVKHSVSDSATVIAKV